jgi:vacuolar-type H+-ATPase subunit F/Vma7
MIVLANDEFALGLKIAGIKKSYSISSKEKAMEILKQTDKNEFIIITESVSKLIPEIEEYPNHIIFPDTVENFQDTKDLKEIIKKALGSELQI